MNVSANWPLVLEFVKALAAPTAALLAVIVASRRAFAGFRAQKLIERRLDWYEEIIPSLIRAGAWYGLAAFERLDNDAETRAAAERARGKTYFLAFKGFLYCGEAGVAAIQRWMDVVEASKKASEAKPEDATKYLLACVLASNALLNEIRKDLGLRGLPRDMSKLLAKYPGEPYPPFEADEGE